MAKLKILECDSSEYLLFRNKFVRRVKLSVADLHGPELDSDDVGLEKGARDSRTDFCSASLAWQKSGRWGSSEFVPLIRPPAADLNESERGAQVAIARRMAEPGLSQLLNAGSSEPGPDLDSEGGLGGGVGGPRGKLA